MSRRDRFFLTLSALALHACSSTTTPGDEAQTPVDASAIVPTKNTGRPPTNSADGSDPTPRSGSSADGGQVDLGRPSSTGTPPDRNADPRDAAFFGADARGHDMSGDAQGPKGAAALATVFNTNVLHQINITLEPDAFANIFTDKLLCDPVKKAQRYSAEVTFDGMKFSRVGARRKGNWGSINANRPGFSLKFDWDPKLPNQRLFGLDKLTLNNGLQEKGFVAEHLAYEVARRAGLAASMTSHALVTVNGVVRGIYIIKESVDGDFLERNFGGANDEGNLYEGEWVRDECGGIQPEFLRAAENPKVMTAMDLKDEKEENRSRADLLAAIDAVRKTSTTQQGGDLWIAEVSKHIDLKQFITFFAVEALTNHADGYTTLANNYFMYHRPDTDRLVFIHHGADQTFEVTVPVDPMNPTTAGAPNLGRFVKQIPKSFDQYKTEVTRILRDKWDVEQLLMRVADVAKILTPLRGRSEPVVINDLKRFDSHRPIVERLIRDRKALIKP